MVCLRDITQHISDSLLCITILMQGGSQAIFLLVYNVGSCALAERTGASLVKTGSRRLQSGSHKGMRKDSVLGPCIARSVVILFAEGTKEIGWQKIMHPREYIVLREGTTQIQMLLPEKMILLWDTTKIMEGCTRKDDQATPSSFLF